MYLHGFHDALRARADACDARKSKAHSHALADVIKAKVLPAYSSSKSVPSSANMHTHAIRARSRACTLTRPGQSVLAQCLMMPQRPYGQNAMSFLMFGGGEIVTAWRRFRRFPVVWMGGIGVQRASHQRAA